MTGLALPRRCPTVGRRPALLCANQAITDTWTYWPYGETNRVTGTTAADQLYNGASGYVSDAFTKRIYVRARYLDTAKARWMTPGSPYAYAYNSPAAVAQPFGGPPGTKPQCTKKPRSPKCTTHCGQWYINNWKRACELCAIACQAEICIYLKGIAKHACDKQCVAQCEQVTHVGTPPKWADCENTTTDSQCQACCDSKCGSKWLCTEQCTTACCGGKETG